MKHKLLAVTLSIAVLSPLALIFSLKALSPFDSVIESQSILQVAETELSIPLYVSDDEVESGVEVTE